MQCAKVKSQLGEWEKDVSTFGATIMSDGWTSAARRDYMNVMVATNKGPYFHSSIDTSDVDAPQVKDAAYVASIIIKAIKDIGPDNVVCIVTDGASVMKAAWTIIEQEFPHIVCVWCAAHVLDLLLEDIGKMAFFTPELLLAKDAVKFINNHQWTRKQFLSKRSVFVLPLFFCTHESCLCMLIFMCTMLDTFSLCMHAARLLFCCLGIRVLQPTSSC